MSVSKPLQEPFFFMILINPERIYHWLGLLKYIEPTTLIVLLFPLAFVLLYLIIPAYFCPNVVHTIPTLEEERQTTSILIIHSCIQDQDPKTLVNI